MRSKHFETALDDESKTQFVCFELNSARVRERVLCTSSMRLQGTEFLGPETGALKAPVTAQGPRAETDM
jgi:hypothetical protein